MTFRNHLWHNLPIMHLYCQNASVTCFQKASVTTLYLWFSESICDTNFLFYTYVFRKHLWHTIPVLQLCFQKASVTQSSYFAPMFLECICDLSLLLYTHVFIKHLWPIPPTSYCKLSLFPENICDPFVVLLCLGVQKASVTSYPHTPLVEMLSHLKTDIKSR